MNGEHGDCQDAMPVAGEKWCLKRDHTRVARVMDVQDGQYVVLEMPWAKKHSGKCMDTFLKQYKPMTTHTGAQEN